MNEMKICDGKFGCPVDGYDMQFDSHKSSRSYDVNFPSGFVDDLPQLQKRCICDKRSRN